MQIFFIIIIIVVSVLVGLGIFLWLISKNQIAEREAEEEVIEILSDHKGTGKISKEDLLNKVAKRFKGSGEHADFFVFKYLIPKKVIKEIISKDGKQYFTLYYSNQND